MFGLFRYVIINLRLQIIPIVHKTMKCIKGGKSRDIIGLSCLIYFQPAAMWMNVYGALK